MADLRLLIVTVGLTLTSVACAQVIRAPDIAGRVVDRESGEPIAGAELFTSYSVDSHTMGFAKGGSVGVRWTTTGPDGEFHFDEGVVARRVSGRIDWTPRLRLFSKHYGDILLHLPEDRSRWSSLRFEVNPDPVSLEGLDDPRWWPRLCLGLESSEEACRRICMLAYGPGSRCEEAMNLE